MRHSPASVLTCVRWLALVVGLLLLPLAAWFGEGAIDAATRPACPAGWWHAGPFWAHCAFPPISIAKYAGTYVACCVLSLWGAYFLAPRFKLQVCFALLFVSVSGPVVWLALHGFSWSACGALAGAGVLAVSFSLGAKAARDHQAAVRPTAAGQSRY